MPKPIPVAIRRQVVERYQKGETLRSIANSLSLPYESARKVWRMYRQEGRIEARYETCGKQGPQASRRVYRAAVWLKRAHPTWGAGLIAQVVRDKWPEEHVPHDRTLQRWFVQRGVQPAKVERLGQARLGRGTAPHHIWEMDSREAITLGNGEQVSWLLVSDEASGAVLSGEVFPLPARFSDPRS